MDKGSISGPGQSALIGDFGYDSSGSLSSMGRAFDSAPEHTHAAIDGNPASPVCHAPSEPAAEASLSRTDRTKPPGPRAAQRGHSGKSPPTAAQQQTKAAAAEIVTTGAFLTRATLRKLGVADITSGPGTDDPGLAVGARIKVHYLDKKWYTAVVLAIRDGKALAHYPLWGHDFNEWISVESRRLLYKGMSAPAAGGSAKALTDLDGEDPELAGFDLDQEMQEAFPTGSDGGPSTAPKPELQQRLQEPRPRGRPSGSKNRRRGGHTKARKRKPSKTSVAQANAVSAVDKISDDVDASDGICGGLDDDPTDRDEEPVAAPPVPKEFRIPEVRVVDKAENPYVKRHRPEDMFDGEDGDGDFEDGASSAKRARDTSGDDGSAQSSSGNAIWHMTRGPYVTTGAFLTRRTIKSLAHSGSTGGIMQDHHGYYPGQLVEVMDANRTWYQGRVISYASKKFLVHFTGWSHKHNEWVGAGSQRMRAAAARNALTGGDRAAMETEEEARKTCVVLVDEYNNYIDESERKKTARAEAKKKARQLRKAPVNPQIVRLGGKVVLQESDPAQAAPTDPAVDEMVDEDVEPISVNSGYAPVPQLVRVKDYTGIFRQGMRVAARDRSKLWWRAEIVDIKAFRIRVHYTGFHSTDDEWMEMNTQRLMFEEESTSGTMSATTDPSVPEDSHTADKSRLHGGDTGEPSERRKDEPGQARRVGRPPNVESKSTPLSLRLALKALMGDRDMYEQCHPGELDVFHLPKEHMSMKDYSTFFKVGDRVRIRGHDKQWRDTTIIDFRHGRIRVCINGCTDEANEWIHVNSERIRVLRETIDSDKRLEKLEREAQVALRRKRERLRARRRKRPQASAASLVRLAENLEYIVDQEADMNRSLLQEAQVGPGSKESDDDSADSEDRPLLQLLLAADSSSTDSMPLLSRLLLSRGPSWGTRGAPIGIEDSATWFVYCNQCNIVIRTFRYYCMCCEHPSDGYDYESYDLCLMCFSKSFPADHPHPPASFARAAVGDVDSIVQFTSSMLKKYRDQEQMAADEAQMTDVFTELLAVYEPDTFDTSYDPQVLNDSLWSKLAVGLHGTTTSTDATTRSSVLGRVIGRTQRGRITSIIGTDGSADELNSSGSSDSSTKDRRVAKGKRGVAPEDFMPRCGFCGEDSFGKGSLLGGFAGGRPFVITSTREDGSVRRRRFWAHEGCAKYSPEVLVSENGQWYNVAPALRRARTIKCADCKRRGATIGCFHERCQKSYHVACTHKPRSLFENGHVFWCPKHEHIADGPLSAQNGGARAAAVEASRCASCSHVLEGDLMWMICLECPSEPSQQFNICLTCYDSKDALADHPHKKRCFREHLSHTGGVSSTGKYLDEASGRRYEKQRRMKQALACHYCQGRQSRRWRKGYGGVVMCETCFNTANNLQENTPSCIYGQDILADGDSNANDGDSPEQVEVVALNPFGNSLVSGQGALVEDYTQSIYFTRETCIASNRISTSSVSQQPLGQLSSYGPTDSMLFTLAVDSTYFDIPGRAPRWGSHSGTDYHGTWLPQTVRRALLRYTKRGERVLSNFLGRGTDAIECFLLSRKCIGVDINPSAVSLSQRNCSFTIPPGSDMSVEFRPAIMQGDARDLSPEMWPGASFFAESESFDHILSHPPYKDCVLYSANIDGDLSRFPGPEEFQREMAKVVGESWRLLKMGRHVTLGIGDNRAECFYIPVSYQLIRTYIDSGFALDELIVKRQRYCQAFGLGMYLCVQFDFLMFTHEFIATLRKVPKEQIDRMHLINGQYAEDTGLGFHLGENSQATSGPCIGATEAHVAIESRTLREVPSSPIKREGVVMGSVWTFEHSPVHSFPHMCMSRMVQRFGRDESNWEQLGLALVKDTGAATGLDIADCADGGDTGDGTDGNTIMDLDTDQSDSEPEFPANGTRAGGYERERQRQIQQNRQLLLNLGLVSELGEDSADTAHYQKMVAMEPRQPISSTPLALLVVPHILNTEFRLRHVEPYRRALVQVTHDASHRLCPSGLLVLGIQDVRDEHGKLWPLGMLVLEDVQRAVGSIRLRLKEFIVVVENGHARKRDDVVSRENFVEEQCALDIDDPGIHVPIVHAYYLVFMKLK
ncbi:hypothetical protein GGF46_001849 [Coemansia sp. RSA 552]|nr:hypothetical protein GGF46_001849 [Coemansia sp. RSA 552]